MTLILLLLVLAVAGVLALLVLPAMTHYQRTVIFTFLCGWFVLTNFALFAALYAALAVYEHDLGKP